MVVDPKRKVRKRWLIVAAAAGALLVDILAALTLGVSPRCVAQLDVLLGALV